MKNKLKKILFIHDSFFLQGSDNNYFSTHLNNDIIDRYLQLGEHVTFLVRIKKVDNNLLLGDKYSQLDMNKCSVIGVPNFKSITGYFKYKRLVNAIVKKTIIEHDIIVPRLPSALSSIAVKYGKNYNKPMIGEVVSCNFDSLRTHSLKGKLLAPYFYFKQKIIIKNMDYLIYVTKKFLQKRYPTKGFSIDISNVVITTQNDEILIKRLKKIKNKEKSTPLLIGMVGSLDVPYKGQLDIIKVLFNLKKKGINFNYHLVGQGNGERLNNWIRKLDLTQWIKIIGPLKHEDIFSFYESLDIYIHSSHTEGLPRALVEAMSCGCPAIAADVGGVSELLDDEFMFSKGSLFEIEKKLIKLKTIDLSSLAIENINKSKEYDINFLNLKRRKMYNMFLDEI